MKNYNIGGTSQPENLRSALLSLIEYAKFMEEESGRYNETFVEDTMKDCGITLTVDETPDDIDEMEDD